MRRTLYSGHSEYQKIEFVETESFGTALILDGILQTTEQDEFIYHEMLAAVPLAAHPLPARVLIIGGGDCGLASTVLQDDRVAHVTMVELDEQVAALSRRSCLDTRVVATTAGCASSTGTVPPTWPTCRVPSDTTLSWLTLPTRKRKLDYACTRPRSTLPS